VNIKTLIATAILRVTIVVFVIPCWLMLIVGAVHSQLPALPALGYWDVLSVWNLLWLTVWCVKYAVDESWDSNE